MSGKKVQHVYAVLAAPGDGSHGASNGGSNNGNNDKSKVTVRIGDVVFEVRVPEWPECVPSALLPFFGDSQDLIAHLRWMAQKDQLGQDMFLTGVPGPLKRSLVLRYAQLAQREIEYVALSRDVTDSDLKQRREIRNGTAVYIDQACVRAATKGRLLILDGVEKAERNVLPVLNNLLENREMALEDGRFLVHAKRYDSLVSDRSQSAMENAKLVRTSESFIVVALGLPVPKYDGFPLDPPLRSRFQARFIPSPGFKSQLDHLGRLYPSVAKRSIERVVSVGMVLNDDSVDHGMPIPEFPALLDHFMAVLSKFPKADPREIMDMCYPYPSMSNFDENTANVINSLYERFELTPRRVLAPLQPASAAGQPAPPLSSDTIAMEYKLVSFGRQKLDASHGSFFSVPVFQRNGRFSDRNGGILRVQFPSGPLDSSESAYFVQAAYHESLLIKLLMAHSSGDICLIGEKGSGKSAVLRAFTRLLGYEVEYIPVHKDMSARDLLQRRNTVPSGDTVWENSGLVEAALNGRVAVLDPIEVLSFGTLASIQRLVTEREVALPSGLTLIHPDRFKMLVSKHGYTAEDLAKRQIMPVHPSFRIIAVARPTTTANTKGTWLTPELASMFLFVPMRPLNSVEENHVIQTLFPSVPFDTIRSLSSLAHELRLEKDEMLQTLATSLSTRQLLRIARRLTLYPNENLRSIIFKASLYRFLPSMAKDAFGKYLDDHKIPPEADWPEDSELVTEVVPATASKPSVLRIGDIEHPVSLDTNPLMIPDVVFYENTKQTFVLQDMLKDYALGEHLLLIGNQGVGKNKLVDRFLQLLRLPREYIQLHRDVTVYSLTSSPTVINGRLVYEDSPLVRAVREGYILVVDEADKAPTHVTSVLKSLVEDGEMVLSDGRRIVAEPVKGESTSKTILIHPNFRMFVLANRPGFPFLGNDFWREIGDVFACHCVDNPDAQSEMQLLKKYAPNVSDDLLMKLISSFKDLRRLVDEGLINYPYSTRELVNVVKHLQTYPGEGLSRALQNVFDFDQHESDVKNILIETMNKNGIPTGMQSTFRVDLAAVIDLPSPVVLEQWTVSPKPKLAVAGKTQEISIRGSWRLDRPKTWEPLHRRDGRAVVFSELVHSFQLPAKGEAVDIIRGGDGSLVALTVNPAMLTIISPDHRTFQSMELYEYIPSTRATTLRLAEIGQGKLCIHNSVENGLVLIDFKQGLISMATIKGVDPVLETTLCSGSEQYGYLVCFQREMGIIVHLDFGKMVQSVFRTALDIASIQILSGQRWVIQETDSKLHLVSLIRTDKSISIETRPVARSDCLRGTPAFLQAASLPDQDNTSWLNLDFGSLQTLTASPIPVTAWVKGDADLAANRFLNLASAFKVLEQTHQVASLVPSDDVVQKPRGWIDLMDVQAKRVRRIKVPLAIPMSAVRARDLPLSGKSERPIAPTVAAGKLIELSKGDLLLMDRAGLVSVFQTRYDQTLADVKQWTKLTGSLDSGTLSIIYEGRHPDAINRDAGVAGDGGGGGESGGEGSPGVGGEGGDGMGGEGGEGSGGSGGTGGNGEGQGNPKPGQEGRQSGTIDAANFKLRTPDEVPKEVTEAQKELHNKAMQARLQNLDMSAKDMATFTEYRQNVQREIRELRVILESVEAKNKERIWLRNKTSGEIDDTKLVEGLAGDRAIYRTRGDNDNDPTFQEKPKKMFFVFDLSASMMRFNGHDGRMDRSLECAITFRGFEHKFRYKICGHSGDGPETPFEVLNVVSRMSGHASFCMSGDTTVAAVTSAVKSIVKDEADDYFVLVLSDANLHQYNIAPATLAAALKADSRVNASMIFIGNVAEQADRLVKGLPGHAHVCLNNQDLPKIMKSIFLASLSK
ncbi:AAA domain-containing protein [Entophlyctis helioformis]|nr:AAA domain-containing protein [Entophlyctis helioformis]